MKILCAPDKFKGTISALDASAAMARGARRAVSRLLAVELPVADGGEGTLDALLAQTRSSRVSATVVGPLGKPVDACFGLIDNRVGVVELASAAGLGLVPSGERDPTRTTTYGAGELIAAARNAGAQRIIVGVGGSATCDGGTGLSQALGARFFDERGALLRDPLTGGRLLRIHRIDRPFNLPPIDVACDVENPLCGPNGAAAVYAPQKGARREQVAELDEGLRHLARLVNANPDTPGFGAAGGAAFGLAEFCGAALHRGIDLVLEAIGFHEACKDAALVLTGEGRLDGQSLRGKACLGVAQAARHAHVETIAIVGSFGPGANQCVHPAPDAFLSHAVSLEERYGETRARRDVGPLLEECAKTTVADWCAGRR